jgi:hypothetical protein
MFGMWCNTPLFRGMVCLLDILTHRNMFQKRDTEQTLTEVLTKVSRNSKKKKKIKNILLYEVKFLVPNYSCLQNPWLGGYCPQIPVLSVLNWICWTPLNKILGYATERNKQQGGSGCEDGTHFVALDVSEKYQSQIQWPLEHMEVSVAFRQSKHGELCSVACTYTYTYYFCEYLLC